MEVKCKSCGNKLYLGYCLNCDDGCVEVLLDKMVDELWAGKKLDKDDISFLKIIKKERPDIANKFPKLFDQIN